MIPPVVRRARQQRAWRRYLAARRRLRDAQRAAWVAQREALARIGGRV